MREGWKTYKLSETFKIIGGGTPKTKIAEYWNGKIPWLSVVDFNNDQRTVSHTEKTITELGLQKSSTKILKKGQIIISARGTVGQLAQLGRDMAFNQSCYGLKGIDKILINDYGYYLLKQSISNIQSNAHGSVFDTITRNTFENIEVNLPPLQEQKAIAAILSTIDDKIELNLQMNKTLEAMAMALYKHWFVDFGPFQEGEFVDSELGKIPKGWEVKQLGDLIITLSKGTTPRKKDVDGLELEIPFLKVKDINDDGSIKHKDVINIPKVVHEKQLKRSILETDDILFSIAGTIGRVSIVPEQFNNSNCNQALAFIRLKDKKKYLALIYFWLKYYSTQNKIKSSIVQGVQANVSLTILKGLKLALPELDILDLFNLEVHSILDKIISNREENQTLTTLRDTLLPKLISGEVRVKDIEQKIANVL